MRVTDSCTPPNPTSPFPTDSPHFSTNHHTPSTLPVTQDVDACSTRPHHQQSRTGRQTGDLKERPKCMPTRSSPLRQPHTLRRMASAHRSPPSPGMAHLPHARNQLFLALHNDGSTIGEVPQSVNKLSLYKRSSIQCTDSATWGSVPRGARKWI